VLLKVPVVPPELKSPELEEIEPPPLMTDQTGEIDTTFPFTSRPVAANCCCENVSIDAGFGVTVMEASAAVTVTVAFPEIAPLVAVTLLANVPDEPPAVNRPPALVVPPPWATDQTGVSGTTLPPASLPTAVYCCVEPEGRDIGFGVTVMVTSGPVVTVTVALLERAPLTALTVLA